MSFRPFEKFNKLNDKFDQLLIRIVSVSDDELLNQLRAEYNDVEEQLKIARANCTTAVIADMAQAHIDNYSRAPCELIKSLTYSKTKKQITVNKKLRLRIPKSLADRRLLIILCQALKYTIYIHDLEGYVVDVIGNGDTSVSTYIDLLTRFTEYDPDVLYQTVTFQTIPRNAIYRV